MFQHLQFVFLSSANEVSTGPTCQFLSVCLSVCLSVRCFRCFWIIKSLRRTLRSLEHILSSRWTLADPSEPAIQWIPRHRNQLADFLSTQTLAKRESWSHCFCPQLHGKRCNLVLFVDGGVRSGKSASAWLIAASTPQHAFFVFRAGGIFWQDSAMTPFAAEVGEMEVGLHELACSVASLSCELAR